MDRSGSRGGEGPLVLAYDVVPGLHERLRAEGFRVIAFPRDAAETARLLDEQAPDLEAIVTIGPLPLPPGLLEAAPKVGLIVCLGAGYENYDPAALAARGVRLVNGGSANCDDVAELALCLLFAARRRLVEADRLVRTGAWTPLITRRNRGRKLGVLGLGAIGRSVAVRAQAFGMEVGWHGPNRKAVDWPYFDDALALARWADDLIVAAKPTPQNEGLVGAAMLDALGPDAVLVNVARGSLVDEPALIAALRSGRIYAAGLDVFAQEPTDPKLWADIPNVVLSPHVGGATPEALTDTQVLAVENVRRHFAGEPLMNLLN
jgi:lactate dehydrogenase-like 2-hydroxyacid dehydrogenase